MRTTMAILMMAAAAAAGDSREDLSRKLDTKVSLELRATPLSEALEIFRNATGLNFVAVDGGDTSVTLAVKDVSARSALRLLLAPRNLTAVFENGAVVVRRGGIGTERVALKVYDVRAMMVNLQNFPGADLSVGPTVMCCLCIWPEEPTSFLTSDFLTGLIKLHAGGRSWDEDPRTSLTWRDGLIYVSQTPRVHREIEALLSRLQF